MQLRLRQCSRGSLSGRYDGWLAAAALHREDMTEQKGCRMQQQNLDF